jgi:hypothetical protein
MAASERGGLHQQSQRRALLGLRRQSVLRVGQTTKPTLKRIVEIAFFLFTNDSSRAGWRARVDILRVLGRWL